MLSMMYYASLTMSSWSRSKQYPRLPVCILADGLYPYEKAFKICEDNDWKFIFVLQDKSLKSVQEELILTRRQKPVAEFYTVKQGWRITEEYQGPGP
jgi:hypothetical protein